MLAAGAGSALGPSSTVFRVYLENLNWVSNAQTASGPTPKEAPAVSDFLLGILALQTLQDRGQIVFGVEERSVAVGNSLASSAVTAKDLIEASKEGLEYRSNAGGKWDLYRKNSQPVMLVDPAALSTSELH